jgi:RNase P subunit RPR2
MCPELGDRRTNQDTSLGEQGRRMEASDEFTRAALADVFCRRCSRAMAIQRLRYVDPAAGFSSIDYKCLSCGHEDMQPYQSENLAVSTD